MNVDPYYEMPAQPTTCNAASIMARSIDGLGYRYHWATRGLTQSDYAFRPSDDSMNIAELTRHIEQLVMMIGKMLGCPVNIANEGDEKTRRLASLQALWSLSQQLHTAKPSCIDNHEKFWLLFNGPLADAFSHVGQLNSWRRINGNPIQHSGFFKGKGPNA